MNDNSSSLASRVFSLFTILSFFLSKAFAFSDRAFFRSLRIDCRSWLSDSVLLTLLSLSSSVSLRRSSPSSVSASWAFLDSSAFSLDIRNFSCFFSWISLSFSVISRSESFSLAFSNASFLLNRALFSESSSFLAFSCPPSIPLISISFAASVSPLSSSSVPFRSRVLFSLSTLFLSFLSPALIAFFSAFQAFDIVSNSSIFFLTFFSLVASARLLLVHFLDSSEKDFVASLSIASRRSISLIFPSPSSHLLRSCLSLSPSSSLVRRTPLRMPSRSFRSSARTPSLSASSLSFLSSSCLVLCSSSSLSFRISSNSLSFSSSVCFSSATSRSLDWSSFSASDIFSSASEMSFSLPSRVFFLRARDLDFFSRVPDLFSVPSISPSSSDIRLSFSSISLRSSDSRCSKSDVDLSSFSRSSPIVPIWPLSLSTSLASLFALLASLTLIFSSS